MRRFPTNGEDISVGVTKIKNRWHARLYKHEQVIDEMACSLKCDIGRICREMLRWYSKLGGISLHADSARHRGRIIEGVTGRVWYRNRLPYTDTVKRLK